MPNYNIFIKYESVISTKEITNESRGQEQPFLTSEFPYDDNDADDEQKKTHGHRFLKEIMSFESNYQAMIKESRVRINELCIYY